MQLLAFIVVTVLGFITGAVVGSRVGWLRRWFTPRRQMTEEVWARARQTFCDRRIYRTAGTSGMLIYVSLFERMAAIVADQTVVEKLGQPALDELCSQLTTQLSRHDPTSAICATIETAGQRLSPLLPRAADDVNELTTMRWYCWTDCPSNMGAFAATQTRIVALLPGRCHRH